MIDKADVNYHHKDGVGFQYAETNSFCFSIPERDILVSVYVVLRKPLGVMAVDVVIYGALVLDRAECLYIDSQQHLPAPESLASYTSANGLSVEAFTPARYQVSYQGYDNVSFDFDFEGLMEPFDINDPLHSPRAKPAASDEERHARSGLGAGYAGHFDVTGKIVGTLNIGGEKLSIDCVETMDHSWGDRPELGIHSMGWMHAHFGKDLAIHWIVSYDPGAIGAAQWSLAHGYVLENGQVYGLTDLVMKGRRAGRALMQVDLEVTDIRGKVFTLVGSSIVGAPWICYVCTECYTSLIRWSLSDGRIGYGASQVNESMQSLTRRLGKTS